MTLQKILSNYWDKIEKKHKTPRYVNSIKNLDFKDLKNAFNQNNEVYLKNLIKNMYEKKEAYILKNAAPKSLKNKMIKLADHYKKTRKSKFYKMFDGCPNFHRAIDKKITKKYSLYAIKHSFYFYNWNIKSKLEKELKRGAYKHWRYIKFLAGNNKNSFENNIPSNGQIDRLQIVRYPAGGGQLRDHVDPRKNQRVVSGIIMGKIGEDFNQGGFYFKSSKNKKINIEDRLDIGDAVIFYGSLVHGVEAVDPHETLKWKSNKGRWFLGMFVNDSDHVKNRITAKDLTGSTKYKN